jgi:hypothetical protein
MKNSYKNRNPVNSYACGNYLVKVRASEAEKCSNIVEDGLEFEGAMGTGRIPAFAMMARSVSLPQLRST